MLHQRPFCFFLFSLFLHGGQTVCAAWESQNICEAAYLYCLSNLEIPAPAHIWPGGRSLTWQPQFPEVSVSACLSCSVQQFAGSSCARCSLSPALNYVVTLPCLFRFNCYKLKWIAKLVWFFKSWRVSGSNEFLLACCYLGMLLRIWIATVGKQKNDLKCISWRKVI